MNMYKSAIGFLNYISQRMEIWILMLKNAALVQLDVSIFILNAWVKKKSTFEPKAGKLNFLLLMAQCYLFSLVFFLNISFKNSKFLARSVQYFNRILSEWSQIMLTVPNYSSWHLNPLALIGIALYCDVQIC